MENGFKQVLKELKQLEETNVTEIFIPSKNEYVGYKPLTMHDQKLVIKTAMDSSSTNITFNTVINDVIMRLSTSEDVITVTDKPAVLLQLRANNIDNKIDVDGVSLKLNKLISTYETIREQNSIKYESTVQLDGIKVRLRVPDLKIDNKFLAECKKHVVAATDVDAVGVNISEMYVYEIAKFIHSVQYSTSTESASSKTMSNVLFDKTSATECLQIVELLPVKINNQIVDFIKQSRDHEALYVKLDETTIPIDTGLFTID